MIAQRHFLPDRSSPPIDFPSCNFGSKAGPPRILSIGRDASKLSTRACNLSSATGCSVKSAAPEAVSNLAIANFYRVALFDDGLCDAETDSRVGRLRPRKRSSYKACPSCGLDLTAELH